MKLAVPVPKDLCSDRREKAIRRRVRAGRAKGPRGRVVRPYSRKGLVPCKDGELRYLRFRLSRQRVLVVVEEDRRPANLSGGSDFRSFALVGRAIVHDARSLWKRLRARTRAKLRDVDVANLLVAALMLKSRPDVILNNAQSRAALSRWPAAWRALALAPPGLRKTRAGHIVLQAWTTGSYHERGISCRYLDGWRLIFNKSLGIRVVHNHKYASGTNVGHTCGPPLPGTPRRARP